MKAALLVIDVQNDFFEKDIVEDKSIKIIPLREANADDIKQLFEPILVSG